MKFDVKRVISIHAEHLLKITLTKTTLDLVLHLQEIFKHVYEKGKTSDDDKEQSLLSINNQTGYQILLHDFIGVEVFFV